MKSSAVRKSSKDLVLEKIKKIIVPQDEGSTRISGERAAQASKTELLSYFRDSRGGNKSKKQLNSLVRDGRQLYRYYNTDGTEAKQRRGSSSNFPDSQSYSKISLTF